MTADQFEALTQARRLPECASRDALRRVLVGGMTVAQAARAAGCTYAASYRALEKHRAWEDKIARAGYIRA